MATTKNVGGALAELVEKLGAHFERWAPILMMFGLVEHKDGKPVPTVHATKAGAHFMGFGTDDEAIFAAVLGVMQDKHLAEVKIITTWVAGLKTFQQGRLRQVIAKKISEFRQQIDDITKNPKGIDYAIGFFLFLAGLADDATRTKITIALNVITKKPPITDKAFQAVKKIKPEKIVDYITGEMNTCNKIVRKNFL